MNILDTALEIEAESIALPAIGVKSKDFPLIECAEAMLYWIIEWSHLPDTGKLRTIKIVNSDPVISDQFKTTLE